MQKQNQNKTLCLKTIINHLGHVHDRRSLLLGAIDDRPFVVSTCHSRLIRFNPLFRPVAFDEIQVVVD